jgi:hypothetical protein
MADLDEATKEKLVLERERLRFERKKFAVEIALKRREAKAPKTGARLMTLLSNPLSLAVVGGFITVMTSVLTTAYTARENQVMEASRAEYARATARDTLQADLIKKFVEGPSPTIVRDNRKFLVDVGLLPTYAKEIRAYLKENPGSAPQLTLGARPSQRDEAVKLDGLSSVDPLKRVGQSVGRLMTLDGQNSCTAFLISAELVANAGRCANARQATMNFVLGDLKLEAKLIDSKTSPDIEEVSSYSLYRLSTALSLANPPLQLSKKPPAIGERLMVVMFREGQLFGLRSPDCRVAGVAVEVFKHTCLTVDPGTGGAPILSVETGEVVGIHAGEDTTYGWATRADAIALNPKTDANRRK